jgi:hypothetical protein
MKKDEIKREWSFEVEDELRGLRGKSRLRFFRIYFTKDRMYLVEIYTAWTAYGASFIMPLAKMMWSPLFLKKRKVELEDMTDIRYIIDVSEWHRRFKLEEVVDMKVVIEPDRCKLVFNIDSDRKLRDGTDVAGEGEFWFDSKHLNDYERVLKKWFKDRFVLEKKTPQ